jgi:hypothetical protein
MTIATEEIARIRTEYLRQAVLWVNKLAAHSSTDARIAAGQLRNYFEWVQDGLLPQEEGPLLEQIESLCSALDEPGQMPGERVNKQCKNHDSG